MCTILEDFLGTEYAAEVNELKSAVKKREETEIGSALTTLGKETVNTLNVLFDPLRAGEERQKACP